MSLTSGRRMLLAVICAVAVATIYVAQPVLAQIGGDLGLPEATWDGSSRRGSSAI